jgi:hypothetical protein
MNKKGVVLETILLGQVQGYFFPLASHKITVRLVASHSTVVITTEINILNLTSGLLFHFGQL